MPEGLVSVIIPTYKHASTVCETLDSVFAQTCRPLEIIVINDGSPDNTAEVLRPLVNSGRIRYIEQANTGQAAARNRGISEAQGAYIALLDDDDLWPADKLEWQVAALQSDPQCVLVYGYYQSFGQVEGAGWFPNSPTGDVRHTVRRSSFIGSPGQTLIRASALRQIGGFDPELWGVDDWDLYIRLSDCGTFAYEERLALRYRLHTGNASKNIAAMYGNALRLREKHFGVTPKPEDRADWEAMGRWIRRHYARELLRNARLYWESGQAEAARAEVARVTKIDPAFCRTREFWQGLAGGWRRRRRA